MPSKPRTPLPEPKVSRLGGGDFVLDFGPGRTHKEVAKELFLDGKVPEGLILEPLANGWRLRFKKEYPEIGKKMQPGVLDRLMAAPRREMTPDEKAFLQQLDKMMKMRNDILMDALRNIR